MRIAIATGPFYPFPPGPAGAVERLMHDLAQRLAARGCEVTLLGRDWPGLPPTEIVSDVRILRLRGYGHSSHLIWNLLRDLPYALRVARNLPLADICLTNSFWLPMLLGFRKGSTRPRIVVNANRFPKGQYRLYARADAFVAASTSVSDELRRQYPGASGRLRVISNPVDTHHFHPQPGSRRTPGLILYTGRIHPLKGLHLLVQAALSLHATRPGIRLRLLGQTSESMGGGGEVYLSLLRRLAASLPLELPGPILDRAVLADELHQASVYVYPSLDARGEALPIAPMEAMACAAPVVVSDLACFRDYLKNNSNGLAFDHRAPSPEAALAQSIGALLDTPGLAGRLGAQAAADMAALDNDTIAGNYLSLFHELLKGPLR